MPTAAAELVFDEATKVYPGRDGAAVDHLSLTVPAGEICVLVGPSGGGKTTALKLVNRLIPLTSGDIRIDGVSILDHDLTELRRSIGYVIQQVGLFPHFTVEGNIGVVPRLYGQSRSWTKARSAELLELVGLDPSYAKRYPAQLSGGQRQRMGLARALAVDPKVLLLDEPFGALDARVRKELRAWLRRLHDETRTTTVIVTHDQEEAMEVADRVVVMHAGHVEQVAPPRELYESPANEFVMSFVGPVNRLGDAFIRPHDVELLHEPNGASQEAMVERIVHLGFEVRVDLVRDDGVRLTAQTTREHAELLELDPGQIVYVRPIRQTVFETSRDPAEVGRH